MSQPTPRYPTELPGPEVRQVRTLLLHALGVQVNHHPGKAFPYQLSAPALSPYHAHRLLLGSYGDALALSQEGPAHLNTPPSWQAALTQQSQDPTPHIIAWTRGYQQAARTFFPLNAPYVPLAQCQPIQVPCEYSNTEDTSAFYSGVRAYLLNVRQLIQVPRNLRLPAAPAPATAKEA